MVLGDPRHAHQRTQSFHFALPHRHSANTRPCCSSAQAPSSLSTSFNALKHSTGSERVDALGRRAVEVIICMITRDFSVISNDVTGVSLSLQPCNFDGILYQLRHWTFHTVFTRRSILRGTLRRDQKAIFVKRPISSHSDALKKKVSFNHPPQCFFHWQWWFISISASS